MLKRYSQSPERDASSYCDDLFMGQPLIPDNDQQESKSICSRFTGLSCAAMKAWDKEHEGLGCY